MRRNRVRESKKFMEYFDGCNVEIIVEDYGSFDKAVKKFMKKVKEDKFLEQSSYSRVYEKPSDKKRRKKRESIYRQRKDANL